MEKPITCHLNQRTKAGVLGALPSGPQSDALEGHVTSAASLLRLPTLNLIRRKHWTKDIHQTKWRVLFKKDTGGLGRGSVQIPGTRKLTTGECAGPAPAWGHPGWRTSPGQLTKSRHDQISITPLLSFLVLALFSKVLSNGSETKKYNTNVTKRNDWKIWVKVCRNSLYIPL